LLRSRKQTAALLRASSVVNIPSLQSVLFFSLFRFIIFTFLKLGQKNSPHQKERKREIYVKYFGQTILDQGRFPLQ